LKEPQRKPRFRLTQLSLHLCFTRSPVYSGENFP